MVSASQLYRGYLGNNNNPWAPNFEFLFSIFVLKYLVSNRTMCHTLEAKHLSDQIC